MLGERAEKQEVHNDWTENQGHVDGDHKVYVWTDDKDQRSPLGLFRAQRDACTITMHTYVHTYVWKICSSREVNAFCATRTCSTQKGRS